MYISLPEPKPIYSSFLCIVIFLGGTSKSRVETGKTYRAATEERTGEVKEIRMRNDPENTICFFFLISFTFNLTIFESRTKSEKTARGETNQRLKKQKEAASLQFSVAGTQRVLCQCNARLVMESKAQGA